MNVRVGLRRVLLPLRLLLAAVFVGAGASKIGDPDGFATAISNFQLFPALAPYLATTLPTIEILAGVTLIAAPAAWRRAAVVCLLGLTTVFTIAAASAVGRGIDVSCGCFGSSSGPVTWLTILRNGVLLAMGATVMALDGKAPPAIARASAPGSPSGA